MSIFKNIKHRAVAEESGFSLIELLVVVLIIGILAAVMIPRFISQRDASANQSAVATLRNAETALGSYYTQNDNFAADKATLQSAMAGAATGEGALTWVASAGGTNGTTGVAKSGNANDPGKVFIEAVATGRFGGVTFCVGSKGTKNYCAVMFGNAPTQRYTLTGDNNVTGTLTAGAFTTAAQTAAAGELLQGSPSTPASFLKPAGTGAAASTALWTAGLSS